MQLVGRQQPRGHDPQLVRIPHEFADAVRSRAHGHDSHNSQAAAAATSLIARIVPRSGLASNLLKGTLPVSLGYLINLSSVYERLEASVSLAYSRTPSGAR